MVIITRIIGILALVAGITAMLTEACRGIGEWSVLMGMLFTIWAEVKDNKK